MSNSVHVMVFHVKDYLTGMYSLKKTSQQGTEGAIGAHKLQLSRHPNQQGDEALRAKSRNLTREQLRLAGVPVTDEPIDLRTRQQSNANEEEQEEEITVQLIKWWKRNF